MKFYIKLKCFTLQNIHGTSNCMVDIFVCSLFGEIDITNGFWGESKTASSYLSIYSVNTFADFFPKYVLKIVKKQLLCRHIIFSLHSFKYHFGNFQDLTIHILFEYILLIHAFTSNFDLHFFL